MPALPPVLVLVQSASPSAQRRQLELVAELALELAAAAEALELELAAEPGLGPVQQPLRSSELPRHPWSLVPPSQSHSKQPGREIEPHPTPSAPTAPTVEEERATSSAALGPPSRPNLRLWVRWWVQLHL